MSIYTSKERLARKLIGRLVIEPDLTTLPYQSIAGFGPSVTSKTIQPELLEDTIRGRESYMTLILAQFYETPLKLTNPTTVDILADIADGLICSKLLRIHYESSVSPISGSQDLGNTVGDWKREAELLLASVSAGSNIFQPVQPGPNQSNYGQPEIQPLVLPGECVLSRSSRPDIISRNYVVVADNTRADANREEFDFSHDQGGCCGGGRGYYNFDKT